MKINDGYIPAHTNQPTTYTVGGSIELNEAMNEVIRGYFDPTQLAMAIPGFMEVLTLPNENCGVIFKEKDVPGSQTIGLFWKIDALE